MPQKFPLETLPCCAFIDSGIGGIPYLQQLNKIAPGVPCIYIADNANFPYGEKTFDEILDAVSGVIQRLLWRFPPAVAVIACNTISVTSLEILRERFPILPIVGTVPAIKKAAAVSKNRIIGLLGSGETVKSPYTAKLIADFASDCKIISRSASRLIRAIERRLILADEAERLEYITPFVQPFINKGADTVILACTHFLHLKETFASALGSGIQIVDSLDGVVQQALRVVKKVQGETGPFTLKKNDELSPKIESSYPPNYIFITGDLKGRHGETYRRCYREYGLRWGGMI